MSDNLTPGFMVRAFAMAALVGTSMGAGWGAIFHDMDQRYQKTDRQPLTWVGHTNNALAGVGAASTVLTVLFAGIMLQRRRKEDRAALEGMKQLMAEKVVSVQPAGPA